MKNIPRMDHPLCQSDICRRCLEFLAGMEGANEPGKEKDARLVATLLGLYPSGKLPDWGVRMAALYLCDEHRAECVRRRVWHGEVDAGAADKGWSRDDVPVGGVPELIGWIVGCSRPEYPGEESKGEAWYANACTLVREELERRTAS